jgi:ABC-type multidrug transport system ATPase subunit
VLLLDDPFGGLDAFERRDVARLIAELRQLGLLGPAIP